jgi:hypothetical protein
MATADHMATGQDRTNLWRSIIVAVVAIVVLVLPPLVPTFYLFLLTRILFLSLVAMSFVLLAGFGGMLSLGQTAFFGLAGYVVAIGSVRYGLDLVIVLPLGLPLTWVYSENTLYPKAHVQGGYTCGRSCGSLLAGCSSSRRSRWGKLPL